jgi:hypothetical protein
MALTPEDIQALKEALKPEFDLLRQEMNERFDRVDESLGTMAEEVKEILSIVATEDEVKILRKEVDRIKEHLHL